MNENKKLMSGIKSKLLAAVCMLLVAVIMVVSSTYAWFTLSTAPEVTGIQTAVGANGALEMLLLTTDDTGALVYNDGIVGEGTADDVRNTYWGNLVDVSNGYGLDQITLYPSRLNAKAGTFGTLPLSVPVYGADGRVTKLDPAGSIGYFDGNSFFSVPSDNPLKGYGVRAIGVSSGLTDKQLTYRNAKANAQSATSVAKKNAATSLSTRGSSLANIAVAKAMGNNPTGADAKALISMVSDLQTNVIPEIEKAYMQYILAFAASATANLTDEQLLAVKSNIQATDATLDSVVQWFTDNSVSLPGGLSTYIAALKTTSANVATAEERLETYETVGNDEPVEWGSVGTETGLYYAIDTLIKIDNMTVNDYPASEVKANLGNIVANMTNGIVVGMSTGAGVYADVADHCGEYSASVTVSGIEFQGQDMGNINASMVAKTTNSSYYLSNVKTAVDNAGEDSTSSVAKPISEFYGYIIDLAFRTNAAESNLLLQAEGSDRIYQDNGTSVEETAGAGSTMTFRSETSSFNQTKIKDLMKCIKIVFFTPSATASESNTIIANAFLDNFANTADGGVTGQMFIAKETTREYYVVTGDASCTKVYKSGENYYKDPEFKEAYSTPAGATIATESLSETVITKDNVITSLTQNEKTNISVMVYLDGDLVNNEDVAATVSKSLVGTMNLQFASSATLVPMEYAELHPVTANQKDININAGESKTIDSDYIDISDYVYDLTGDDTISFDKTTGTISTTNTTDATATLTITDSTGKLVMKYNITSIVAASSGS